MTLEEMIIKHEGSKKDASGKHILYKCPAGKWTGGYGRNLEDNGISEEEAVFMLRNDIARCRYELQTRLSFWLSLPVKVQEVFIDMNFNMGLTRFLGFKGMLEAAEKGNWKRTVEEMLDSKWAEQVPNRAKELAEIVKSI